MLGDHMNCVLIFIASQQKGLFISIGKLLRDRYRVVFVAAAEDVKFEILKHLPDAEIVVRTIPAQTEYVSLEEMQRLEDDYGETFALLVSTDRALGHGYLFNVDCYPATPRRDWNSNRKFSYIAEQFGFYKNLIKEYQPVLAINLSLREVQYLVFKRAQVPIFALGLVKFGTRLFWYDCPKYTSETMKAKLASCLADERGLLEQDAPNYAIEKSAYAFNSKLRFSYRIAVAAATKHLIRDFMRLVGLRRRKKSSYGFGIWVPHAFRRIAMHNFINMIGIVPSDLLGRRVIFVPLHLEPEIALLSVSPEFNNSMEMVTWISKSAPADCVIVLKEHLSCLGNRSRQYYQRLRSLPNVQFARLDVTSWDWINTSSVVATITGTAGTEAVYFDRPVLSFGAHQLINALPTVRFADCYASTRRALRELLAIERTSPEFHKAKVALHQTLIDGSFEFPGFELSWSNTVIDEPGAATSLRYLAAKLPGQFDAEPDNMNELMLEKSRTEQARQCPACNYTNN
jgi:hypothetical protein